VLNRPGTLRRWPHVCFAGITGWDYLFVDNVFGKPRVDADWQQIHTNQSQNDPTIQTATRQGYVDYWTAFRSKAPNIQVMGNNDSDLTSPEFNQQMEGSFIECLYGKSWSTLGRLLDPLTQDACAFYGDHGLFDDYTGVVLDTEEGKRIAHALGENKAVILRNHGLLTVGHSVEEAVWWYVTMERSCQAQLLAEAAGTPIPIDHDVATLTCSQVGAHVSGFASFQPLYQKITREQPDLFE